MAAREFFLFFSSEKNCQVIVTKRGKWMEIRQRLKEQKDQCFKTFFGAF
jgi:hypothetical protein